ncbi:MAG TPA: hypothetical protein VG733_13780 [Chthoniobacteraceae bacterium]|nr:hypothetical protein [Chthoniobacteraceae bacterium]
MNRPGSILARYYPWAFAVLAAVLVAVRYLPAVCLSTLTADCTQIPLMYHDVIQLGHPSRDWGWGGHSDLFPDVLTGLLLNFIFRDGIAAIKASFGVVLTAYIIVALLLHRKCGARNTALFGALLLVFFVLSLVNFGSSNTFLFENSLAFTYHTGTNIVALACLGLSLHAATRGFGKVFLLLPVLCFASAISDDLFQVTFPAPMLATLLFLRILYPETRRMFLPLVAAIVIPCLAGHFLGPRISPFQIDAAPYTHYNHTRASHAWRQLVTLCRPSVGGVFPIFAILDLIFITFVAVVLVSSFFKPADKRLPLPIFLALLFSACAIDSNWGAVLLTGDFDTYASRYIHLAVMLPVLSALGYLSHVVPWSRAACRAAIAALMFGVGCLSVFVVPQPGPTWQRTQALIPVMRDLMEKNHIEAGLADYWTASPVALASRGSIPLRAALSDGSFYHWLNTTVWCTGDQANPPPKFGMIHMFKLDPEKVRQHYGSPDQVVPTSTGSDIWLYLGEHVISYNPVFGTLSNGPLNEIVTDGSLLPSFTGKPEGHSRVARAGRDPGSFLVYGPYPYLSPVPGRYRVTILHSYPAAPRPSKLAFYDFTYDTGRESRALDQARIPFIDNAQHEFTREVTVPEGRGQIQVRVQYFGSGDMSIDSLKIEYLGK